jgi:hypothetical protein
MFDHAETTIPQPQLDHNGDAAAITGTTALAEIFLSVPPSERIRMSIADLEVAEGSADYSIDMDTWHAPDHRTGTCAVCMAGAVLASRHPIRPHQIYVGPFDAEGPDEFSTTAAWDRIFTGLDELRHGYVDAFLLEDGRVADAQVEAFVARFGPADPREPFPGHVAYDADPAAFKAWALTVADKLAEIGL